MSSLDSWEKKNVSIWRCIFLFKNNNNKKNKTETCSVYKPVHRVFDLGFEFQYCPFSQSSLSKMMHVEVKTMVEMERVSQAQNATIKADKKVEIALLGKLKSYQRL